MTHSRHARSIALRAVTAANAGLRRLAEWGHRAQLWLQWEVGLAPEWFDTYIAQYSQWRRNRTPWLWDRGVYNVLGMKPGGRVLDICCGGGFYTRHFYSGRAAAVVAVDFDPTAIAHARRRNAAPNVRYELCDIRRDLPAGPFDHVVWDGAIEHFTEAEMGEIIARLKARMAPGAILSGYTVQERADGTPQHDDHEHEFKSKEEAVRLFQRHFANVLVFETAYDERNNLHFMASDGVLPFDAEWAQAARGQAMKRAA